MTDSNDDGERPRARSGGDSFRRRPAGPPPSGGDRPPFRPRPEGGRPGGGAGPKRFDTSKGRGAGPNRPRRDDKAPPVASDATEAPPAEDRIAKVIARAGLASRRDAEVMIAEGRVAVNGTVLTSPALNVGPSDTIAVDGEPLPLRERTRLWLFHKPRGLVTTARDPEGRTTVFDALPEDLPRVVAIGRLDINTEGLLLLTNDGGLAKVVAHPETGWTRRYRARAHGEVTQEQLDRLRHGVTVDGMEYGAIEATLDRVQGDNLWITLALREGKNREVKRILEHLGLQVNRLIRLSFGPFQLGELEAGLVEEVRTRVLKDQLGDALATEAGVDFESPVREPIAPFGSPKRAPDGRAPRPRSARPEPGDGRHGERGADRGGRGEREERRGGRPDRDGSERGPHRPEQRRTVWRDGEQETAEQPKRPIARRENPKAERAAAGERRHERVGAIQSGEGRKVLVERVAKPSPADTPREGRSAPRGRRDGPPRRDDGVAPMRERDEHPARAERPSRVERPRPGDTRDGAPRPARKFGSKPGGARFEGEQPPRADRPGGARPFGKPGAGRSFGDGPGGAKPGGAGKFGGGKFGGGKFGAGRPGAGKPGGGSFGAARPGGRPGGARSGGGPPKGRAPR